MEMSMWTVNSGNAMILKLQQLNTVPPLNQFKIGDTRVLEIHGDNLSFKQLCSGAFVTILF